MQKRLTVIALICLITLLDANQIIDYSYSQYQKTSNQKYTQQSSFLFKAQSAFQRYDFPQSCDILTKLEYPYQSTSSIEQSKIQAFSTDLKEDFNELMRLSQLIKITKKRLKESAQLVLTSRRGSGVSPSQLEKLAAFEKNIVQINQKIEQKAKELTKYSSQSLDLTHQNKFAEFELKYSIDSLSIKLQYLKSLKSNSPTNVSMFSSQIKSKLANQKNILSQIQDQINSKLTSVPCNKQGILASISVYEAKISNAQEIESQFKYKGFGISSTQIEKNMKNLRQYKKNNKNTLNKYCLGLVVMMTDRIRGVLQQCDFKYNQMNKLQSYRQELIVLQRQLQNCQVSTTKQVNSDRTTAIQISKSIIQSKIQEVSNFRVQDFSYYTPQERKTVIEDTQTRIKQAKQKLERMKQQKTVINQKQQDFRRAKILIQQLKGLKATYCRQNERYQEMAEALKNDLRRFKQETQYAIKIQKSYQEQLNVLKNNKLQFQSIKQKILLKLN